MFGFKYGAVSGKGWCLARPSSDDVHLPDLSMAQERKKLLNLVLEIGLYWYLPMSLACLSTLVTKGQHSRLSSLS